MVFATGVMLVKLVRLWLVMEVVMMGEVAGAQDEGWWEKRVASQQQERGNDSGNTEDDEFWRGGCVW